MKNIVLMMIATSALTGCLQPDDLIWSEAGNARQELRLRSYAHFSCTDLRLQHAANLPARNGIAAILPTGVLGRETLADIEEMMRRKKCRT